MMEVALKAAIAKLEHAKVLVVRGEHVAWDMGGEEEGDSWHVEDAMLRMLCYWDGLRMHSDFKSPIKA
ncbi:hypothetical protein M422DRAFT_252067 [Sphaerobolus stellatus SS14]|uniref:Uncharacterized protein n=1 Tax=Sphaerobolus stellatus (strain SS14) TaxID=990650 RepID=A0A0C9VQB4_SPHS4|nr:hypothetical protein M422DRAFT_252067 [Sphaerobolus stellatus SS14]